MHDTLDLETEIQCEEAATYFSKGSTGGLERGCNWACFGLCGRDMEMSVNLRWNF